LFDVARVDLREQLALLDDGADGDVHPDICPDAGRLDLDQSVGSTVPGRLDGDLDLLRATAAYWIAAARGLLAAARRAAIEAAGGAAAARRVREVVRAVS